MISESPNEEVCTVPPVSKIYTAEELENIAELGAILQGIHNRLIAEGHSIEELSNQLEMSKPAC